MRIPRFLQLVQIDDQHFITACRHGLVHLTWGRATVRFSRDEFRRLAGLLGRATDGLPPTSVRDGELRVTYQPEEDCEFRMGALVLLMSPPEFREFARVAGEAIQRLDKFLASGAWDREEAEDVPLDFSEQLRRNPFSLN
jgi:hypothetical protein